MSFELRKAERRNSPLKIALCGPSGSGKTYSALLLAKGIAKNWEDIILIDTENGSGEDYSDLGPYQVIPFRPPFSPEQYALALDYALSHKPAVVVIDSVTHEWDGEGGILSLKDEMGKNNRGQNEFAAWGKLTPLHTGFINKLIGYPVHLIVTCRSKSDYVLELNSKGKHVPRKVGTKAIQREGFEFEFKVVFQMSADHTAFADKDRTQLFKNELTITEATGETLLAWNQQAVADLKLVSDNENGFWPSMNDSLTIMKKQIKENGSLTTETRKRFKALFDEAIGLWSKDKERVAEIYHEISSEIDSMNEIEREVDRVGD